MRSQLTELALSVCPAASDCARDPSAFARVGVGAGIDPQLEGPGAPLTDRALHGDELADCAPALRWEAMCRAMMMGM